MGRCRGSWCALVAVATALVVPASAPAALLPAKWVSPTCGPINPILGSQCRGAEQVVGIVAPKVTAADLAAYEASDTHRTLAFQHDLANDVPLRDAPWLGTHNSFNSTAEMGPALSAVDSNQRGTLLDQLRMDVRSLELDLHWWVRPLAPGGFGPVVCHAQPAHEGCTIEKSLWPVLGEIEGWLRGHRDQVLLLYLEDHLDGRKGNDAAAEQLQARLGDLIYTGATNACEALPLDLTRSKVLAAGKQVVIVTSGCGAGTAWPALTFDWRASHEEGGATGFTDFPACGREYTRADYDRTMIRYYEDSTWLTATVEAVGGDPWDEGITATTAGRMWRCGVDLLGLDQLMPGPEDGRLQALAWSWDSLEPSAAGDCAVQGAAGRWRAVPCTRIAPAACRTATGAWSVTAPVTFAAAPAACAAAGAAFAAPRTGYEAQLLRVAAAGQDSLLGLRRVAGRWTPQDARP